MQSGSQFVQTFACQRRDGIDRCIRGDRSLQLAPHSLRGSIALRGIQQIDLRKGDEHAAHVKKLQDLQMLERLRHHALAGIYREQQELHAGGAGKHIVKEPFVARHVDDAGFNAIVKA